jgi:DNA gyrase/topoisomerase IV subunit A
VPSEAITVVLSEKGWVRAAKGHDIDAGALAYKSGDGFLASATGRSNQLAVFLDSTGRTYSLPAHALPSARGHGEPLVHTVKGDLTVSREEVELYEGERAQRGSRLPKGYQEVKGIEVKE